MGEKIRVVTRDLDVCPHCGSKLYVHHVGTNLYEVTAGGFLTKEVESTDEMELKCSKCKFKVPVVHSFDGSITIPGYDVELPKLETPNSIGKVEDDNE